MAGANKNIEYDVSGGKDNCPPGINEEIAGDETMETEGGSNMTIVDENRVEGNDLCSETPRLLAENTHDLGMGYSATARYTVFAPPPPDRGTTWDHEDDFPIVTGELLIRSDHEWVPADLSGDYDVLGKPANSSWSRRKASQGNDLFREVNARRDSISDSLRELRGKIAPAIANIREHVAARAGRLAQRNETIRLAFDGMTSPTPS